MPRGRPKKGKKTWRPAAMLNVNNAPDGYRLRWVSKDPMNLQKKQAEGWIPANSIEGFNVEHEQPGKVGDGSPLTSVVEYRDMVLYAMDEETAKARDEYVREKTLQQTVGLKEGLEKDLQKTGGTPAETYGKIVIE